MILGKNSLSAAYAGIHPLLDRALGLLRDDGFLAALGTETQYLEGEALYATRFAYDTLPPEETFFEAHRRYLDIHLMLRGRERVELAHPGGLTLFEQKGDFYAYRGEAEQRLLLSPGTFLVVFPEDAHRIKLMAGDRPEPVEKAVFKILLYP
ncbi:MAG: YhcH/YjgK/YiaL family protein [Oscillospiraceae bacterium]|nr:YhcH/YjgK/YiaL family protein [Oscillospiraceae bacterium]